jgi:hypothetical protein
MAYRDPGSLTRGEWDPSSYPKLRWSVRQSSDILSTDQAGRRVLRKPLPTLILPAENTLVSEDRYKDSQPAVRTDFHQRSNIDII